MIRQVKKILRIIKKAKRKISEYCQKKVPILKEWKLLKKKAWALRYYHIGSLSEKKVVFCSNGGKDCSGYPRYLYEQMKKDGQFHDYKFVWLFQKKDAYKYLNDERTRIYNLESKKGIRQICHAHYLVANKDWPDYIRLRKAQVYIFEPEKYYGYLFYHNATGTYESGEASKEATDQLFRFIIPELGSADGKIKKYLRNKKYLFAVLKKINQGFYGIKSVKKKTVNKMKYLIKILDLKFLYVYYSCNGLLRKKGIGFTVNTRRLISYQNKYQGQRCFLIGNGPSLTVHDLELLQGEVTFACNGIYKLFNETTWRPTYFCMIDALIAKYRSEELTEAINCPMFTNINTRDLMKVRPKDLIFARNLGEYEYRVSDNFAAYYVPSGATVMTFMLELAMYMGFKDIYLLGVDCTSSLTSKGHCVEGYANEELIQKDIERIRKRLNDSTLNAEQVAAYYFAKSTSCYRVIREYADAEGICIYNSTRGGMLEVFERRNLDEVIN